MTIQLKAIERTFVTVRLVGSSPYISHKWSEKAISAMRDKHAGKKTKAREKRDPEAEAKSATYVTSDGQIGLPAVAIKTAMITAAHKDLGIEKTLVRKAVFLCTDEEVIPIEFESMRVREDTVRVGSGSTDLRYRPQFDGWSCELELEINTDLLQVDDLINLLNLAGFSVGIGEMRPEKNKEFGRFRVCDKQPVEVREQK